MTNDRLIPFTLNQWSEPLNVFNYRFKGRKRSLIACVMFNNPPFIIMYRCTILIIIFQFHHVNGTMKTLHHQINTSIYF